MSTTETSPASASNRKRIRRNGIRKHGTGFQARLQINGITEAKSFATRAEVNLWLQLKRGQLQADAGGGYDRARNMTVADLFREYAENGVGSLKGAS